MARGAQALATRRMVVAGLLAGALASPARAQQTVGFVSRDRVLRESQLGTSILSAESAATADLQRAIDVARAQLDAEEEALSTGRAELTEDAFEERTQAFDQRFRASRRVAQERAQTLQRIFQDLRAQIVARLPEVIERVRAEAGVSMILNADHVLAAEPGVDFTERAIALFNDQNYAIAIPDLDMSAPLLPSP